MLFHLCCALVLAVSPHSDDNLADSSGEQTPVVTIGEITLTGAGIVFKSDDSKKTCLLEGKGKIFFGDIEITADKIQLEMRDKGSPSLLICNGNCTWKQDDERDEFLSGDQLTLAKDGLVISGNARIQYGSDQDQTVLTCDKLTAVKDGYEFSGNVKLLRRK